MMMVLARKILDAGMVAESTYERVPAPGVDERKSWFGRTLSTTLRVPVHPSH